MKDDKTFDFTESSFRESLLEHLFVAEILKEAWLKRTTIEVLRPEVDNTGYDLVLEFRGAIRYVQLKVSRSDASTRQQTVNVKLAEKPGGCVVWLLYSECQEPRGIALEYLVFPKAPGQTLLSLQDLHVGKHTRGNRTGFKAERPNTRVISRSKFTKLSGVNELMDWLFGQANSDTDGR